MSDGLLRIMNTATGTPNTSTITPDTIHATRQLVATISSDRNGIMINPPSEPPAATMDIAIPRLRWNQREMIAPVVPGATPPEKKDMTNPNTTVNMMTLLIEASAKYESPITARLTMTTIRPPRTSTSFPRMAEKIRSGSNRQPPLLIWHR